jgi:hypothetical protein
MQLNMSSRGNPDFRENPNDALSPIIVSEVASWQEASAACDAYIAQYHLGGGNWTGGQIYEQGQQLARVSYNGRVWDMDDHCIYEPTND